MKKFLTAILAVFAIVSLSACVGPTPEQQTVTLQYEGGAMIRTAPKFSACVLGGTKGKHDFGGKSYTYPANQRVVDFNGGDGSDRGPITIVSKDGLDLVVPGSLQYQLNTDCAGKEGGVLGSFHTEIGRRYDASFDEGPSKIPAGWREVQRLYVETPLETAMDRAAKNYNALDLVRSNEVKIKWENEVREAIRGEIDRSTPTDAQFYINLEPRIGAPQLTGERGEQIKAAIADGEKNVAAAKAAEAAAKANQAAAEAQIAVSKAEAAKKAADIAGYGSTEAYNRAKLAEAGINIYQPTVVYGAPPQAQPTG